MTDEFDTAVAKTLDQSPAADQQPGMLTTQDYDVAVQGSLHPNQAKAARAGFALAYPTDPDSYAEAQAVARRANLPVQTVLSNPTQARQQVAIGSIDFDTLSKTSPATAALLADIEKAKVAHDDVGTLSGLESVLRPVSQAVRGAVAGLVADPNAAIYGTLETGAKLVAPKSSLSSWLEYQRKGAESFSNRLAGDQTGLGFTGQSVVSGFRSFGQMLPGMGLTLLTGNPAFALTSAGVMQGSQSATKALDAGKSPAHALLYGTEDAAAEVATEMLPLGRLLGDVKAGSSLWKILRGQIATEVPTEMAATAWQNFNEWANINPDKPFSSYLQELPEAEAQTVIATVTTTLLTAGLGRGVQGVARRAAGDSSKAQAGMDDANLVQQLNDTAKASKLLQRAPDTFQQFVSDAAENGPVSHVFISADALMQSGVAEEVAQASPTVAAQLPIAARTGGDIAIPVDEYAAKIAPTEAANSLLDHLRTDQDGFSRAEAQTYLQTQQEQVRAEVEKAAAQAQNEDSFKASVDQVHQAILTQLNDAGRFTPDVNQSYATLASSWYAVKAAERGITPEEQFKEYPLRVQAEGAVGNQVLNQQAWHGSPHRGVEQQGFKLNKIGTGEGNATFGWGIYFASKRAVSDSYRKNLSNMPTDPADLPGFEVSAAWRESKGSKKKALAYLDSRKAYFEQNKKHMTPEGYEREISSVVEARRRIESSESKFNKGQLYSAEIPEDSDMLDWDKPLSKQPSRILKALRKLLISDAVEQRALDDFGVESRKELADTVLDPSNSGEYVYGTLSDVFRTAEGASRALQSAGIPGLHYLDGNSRAKGKGSRNYVIWDEAHLGNDIQTYYQNGQGQPAATIRGDEFGGVDTPIKELRAKAQSWYVKHLQTTGDHGNKPIINLGSGKTIQIPAPGKAFSTSANSEKIRLFAALPDLLRNGQLFERGPVNDPRHPNVKAYHWLEGDVQIGDRVVRVGVTIREDDKGNLYYNHNPIENGKGLQAATRSASAHKAEGGITDETLEQSVVQPNDGVNLHVLDQSTGAPRGTFSPSTLTISLLKNADLSTFLHETGHFFLEAQADMASRPDAPESVRKDMAALLKWFNVRDLTEWYGLDPEVKRTYHEQFARGFEAYLFEGKSPSIEMQGLFQKFRAWMLNVYHKLTALNVELSDDVRGVFDRMLATNDQIQLAEQGRSMMPLFESAEEAGKAGINPEEYAAYQALEARGTQDAVQDLQARGLRDMQWLRNARGRVLKGLQKNAAQRRAEMRIEARREVLQQPVYRAWQFLTARMGKGEKRESNDQVAPIEVPKSDPKVLDPAIDSLFVAIAKLGGLDRDEVKSQWGTDHKEVGSGSVFGKPILRAKGGRSLDDMRQALIEHGYLDRDESSPDWNPREFEDKFDAELRGDTQYSMAHDPGVADAANLKAGEQLANPTALMAGRLDAGELVIEGYPSEVVDALKAHRMVAKHGLHPDVVAELFGFTSGDEMVRALAQAQPLREAIDATTDAKMLERYGDLATPEALEHAADAAIHNDARARFTAAEAGILERLANPTAPTGQTDRRGRPTSRGVLLPAARELARGVIARTRVRDMRPGQYTTAEARAGKNAKTAMSKGDVAQAAAEKRNQVIQQQLARQALEAQDEVERTVRFLKKFDREGVRKSLDPDFRDQIDTLLERFDLRTGQSLKAIDKRASLAAWIEAQAKTGVEPDIAPYLVADANRTSYKNLTVEELRGLADAVRQIEHLGRLKNRLLTDKKNREFAAVRDEVVAQVEENGGKPISQDRRLNRTTHGALSRAGRSARELWAAHMNIAEWVRRMSGNKDGGTLWEYLVRTANERAQFESDKKADATLALAKILDPVVKLQKMGGAGKSFPSISRSLNAEERFAIALNMGNEGNIQRVLGGENWTPQQIMPVLESLTEAEWHAVQQVWDYIETYRPLIAAKQRRVYGVEPNWVEPQALTINTADGKTITLRGGYYPIKYDPARSTAAQLHDEAEQIKLQMGGGFTSTTTSRSFTKARADDVKGRPILYSLSGLYSGMNEVIHDLAWHEFLIDANRLVKDKRFGDAVRLYHGAEVVKEFTTWTRDIATGDRQAHGVMDASIAHLRQMLSASRMGFSIWTAVMQPLGLTQSVVRIGGHWTGEGIKTYLVNPAQAIRTAQEKSPFMASRNRTKFRELNQLRALVERQGKVREFLARYPYWLMLKATEVAEVPTWHGAYLKAQSEGHDEAASVALADQAVIDSQSSGELHNRARVQRGGELSQLMTPFMTFMRTSQALSRNALHGADTPAKRGKAAADLLMIYLVPSVTTYLFHALLMPQGGDDDDSWAGVARGVVAETLSYMMSGFVGLNQVSSIPYVFESGRPTDYAGPAALSVFGDLQHVGSRVAKAARGDEVEFNDAFARALINLAGDTTGIPSSQINRTLRGVKAITKGRTKNPVDAARAVIFGAPAH
ncbi:MAG TPA: hypothetical protein VF285_03060 [Castellaniella sp.]|uniref:LPD3 domain-containing protein n=1 Tax=Castellaniella sp. TaxID=1955812 RepID=UPI002F075F89